MKKILLWVLLIVLLLFLLLMVAITPVAWIGVLITLFGLYQLRQKSKGKMTFAKPGRILTLGIILTFILAFAFVEPAKEQAKESKDTKVASVNKEDKKEEEGKEKEEAAALAKKEEEQKAKEEAEVKAKEEAEAKAKAEEEAKRQQEKLVQEMGLEAVTVASITDGDTVVLSDGRKIRFIGVNTPESTTRTEEYGKESSQYTKSKLEGKQVWIQKDVSETDRYSRYLRFVWLAIPTDVMNENEIRTKMFNADLVLNGYAEPSTYAPDVKYSDYFVKFAQEARNSNTGLWAYGPEGTTKGDLDTVAASSSSNSNTNTTTSSNTSTSTNSNTTVTTSTTTESYQNCTELRKVYPNGVASDHPAYESKHDRDKDNWACER